MTQPPPELAEVLDELVGDELVDDALEEDALLEDEVLEDELVTPLVDACVEPVPLPPPPDVETV